MNSFLVVTAANKKQTIDIANSLIAHARTYTGHTAHSLLSFWLSITTAWKLPRNQTLDTPFHSLRFREGRDDKSGKEKRKGQRRIKELYLAYYSQIRRAS